MRAALAGLVTGFVLLVTAGPAEALLLPAGFFDSAPQPGNGAAAVEADRMAYDAQKGLISAEGDVVLSWQGYVLHADSVEYDQASGAVHATGHVVMRDPTNNIFTMDSIEVTGGMKEAFINSLTLTTDAGALITARDVHYTDELVTTLTAASYSPCGLCIDSKGRKIGWKVKAARMVYDRAHAAVYLEQPSLELLGIPVAWLPWFWVPDPTQPRARGLRMPSISSDAENGIGLTVPYFIPTGEDVDILLSPRVMSRQGFLMQADVAWRFPTLGEIDVSASGLYQLDPSAYAGTVGDRTWRGAIQTSGRFTPIKDWTVGWSYSLFTDNAYLGDYGISADESSVNQIYATNLTDSTYFDARLQHFNWLGDHPTDDPRQADTLPVITFSHVQELPPGLGQVNLSGKLLSLHRGDDQTATYNGVPYVFGNEGNKQHLMLEGAWQDQFILPGGVAATPYLGVRLDATNYDRTTGPIGGIYPTQLDASLLSATPIAAMDVRWPLLALNGNDTHLLEPIAQLVYRGSSTTRLGITNDDAQSFVFDTSNLFSYNRFSGIDRQETGLNANLGVHYVADFADGSWLDLVAGQSFHLLGPNAMGTSDEVQVGTSTGLGGASSFIVASARGGFSNGLSFGSAVQVDPATPRVTRAGAGVSYAPGNGWSAGADYLYLAPDAALGILGAQHSISGRVGVPVYDYWTLTAGMSFDLNTVKWSGANTGVTYDDGYLVLGANATFKPTSWGFGVKFGLKGPDGDLAF